MSDDLFMPDFGDGAGGLRLRIAPGGPRPIERILPVDPETVIDLSTQEEAGPEKGWFSGTPGRGNWIVATHCDADGAIDELVADMTVPQPPLIQSGQTLFIFIGLQDRRASRILQPVLQWNAPGGPDGWSVSSWLVETASNVASPTPAVSVHSGATLRARIMRTRWTATEHEYECRFDDLATTLKVKLKAPLSVAVAVLEAYGVESCREYPANPPIRFDNVRMQPAGRQWDGQRWSTACDQKAEIVLQPASLAFRLKYGT